MKIVQFIHPMFLVALGLHASVMFVPVGPNETDSALIEEDVPLASITETPQPQNTRTRPGTLPLPDPNVSTGTAKPGAIKVPAPAAKIATAPVPPPTAVAIRRAPVPKPAVRSTGSGTGTRTTTETIAASSSASNSEEAAPVTPAVTAPPPRPSAPANTASSPGSFLPDLTADSEEEIAANSTANTNTTDAGGNGSVDGSPSLSGLIASAQTEVPSLLESLLEDLSDGLIYRPEDTDDESAQRNIENWTSSFGQQANAARIENVEPVLISDVEMNYPIEAAKTLEGRSLSVCLDETPHNAQVGLMFDAEGELIDAPVLIRSTGYDALNLEALALVTDDENLAEDRASKAYLYDVAVDYDDQTCVSLKELKS